MHSEAIPVGVLAIAAAMAAGLFFGRAAKKDATERFRSLVTSATDLILTTDATGIITYASPSAQHVLGYTHESLLGTTIADLIHPDDLGLVSAESATMLDCPGRTFRLLYRARNSDQVWVQIEATYTNLLSDPHVNGIVVNGRDVTDRYRLMSDLVHKAFHDELTGLANRALLRDRLDHALARSRRSGATTSVLFCDLDGFKLINDSLGHDAGDQLLVEVARRLEFNVRDGDTPARLGGDEFAILLEESTPGEAISLARRTLEALRVPFSIDGRELHIRASIGIADNGADALDAEEILIRADIAMYAAKARGRDQFAIFEDAMQSEITTRHEIHEDLRRALDLGEFEVYYQPLVNMATDRIDSMEALVRWNHPTRGTVGPEVFIPIAEDTGLISAIGLLVLREACRQTAAWQVEFPAHSDVCVGVNVAAVQLQEPTFVADVAQALADTGLPGHRLTIEITEGTLLSDTAIIQNQLVALKQLGIEIAVDDFGTGYSSLSYLCSFPVDYLKIDQSFVRQLCGDGHAQAIVVVRSIIGLGHNLNMRVIAEGIEHGNQLHELRAAGCDLGQGYLFARPLPEDAMTTFLARALDEHPSEAVTGRIT